MDLLQEISNRFREKKDGVWQKVSDLFYEATVGLLKQYQEKTIEFVKLSAAAFYLQGLKVMRRHVLLFLFVLFGVFLSAVAAVVIPVAIVLLAPIEAGWKIGVLLLLGVLYFGGTVVMGNKLLSEERWMKTSGFEEFVASITGKSKE